MRRSVHLTLLLAAALALLAVPIASGASPDLVVSQVYGGGGNSGATYANDFVELFNRGSASVDLSGWSVQYATAAGTSWQVTPLAGSLAPGHHYLVALASGGTNGAALPAADATGTSNLAASGGKVALVHDTAELTCGATAGSCSAVAVVRDLVGYGSATDYEGAAAPALSNTAAAIRGSGGCDDTDANGTDFTTDTPSPRTTSTAAMTCTGTPPPAGSGSGVADVGLDLQSTLSIALEKPTLSFGNASPGRLARCAHRPRHRHQHERRRLHAQRAPERLRAGRPPARARRDRARQADTLGPSLAGGARVALPVAPAADLLVGTTSAPSAASGDAGRRASPSPLRSRHSRRATTRRPSPSR